MNTPLTIFAVPKPFIGHTAIIQRNAIQSWTLLNPRPNIILLGRDDGVAEIASDLHLKHIPDVALSRQETPLVSSIFHEAEKYSSTPWLVYMNADCILLDDFSSAVNLLTREIQRLDISEFLLCSQRMEIDLDEPISFHDEHWLETLQKKVAAEGIKDFKTAVEMFFFTRGFFEEIPPFVIGRPCWDNWMLWKAFDKKAKVIDATEAFRIVHQCHDYSHVQGGWKQAWKGDEAQQNLYLSRGRFASINNVCNHVLSKDGLHEGFFIPDNAKLDLLLARRIQRGMREIGKGNYARALDFLNDAEERSHEYSPIESLHLARAICMIHLEEYAEAAIALEKELNQWPDNNEAKHLLAQILGKTHCKPFS